MRAIKALETALLQEDLTPSDLAQFKQALTPLLHTLGMDINLSVHFGDRANDPRNGKPITLGELITFMNQQLKTHWKEFKKPVGTPEGKRMPEGVLKDVNSNLNLPVGFEWDSRNKIMRLRLITVYRKKNFIPNDRRDRVFRV